MDGLLAAGEGNLDSGIQLNRSAGKRFRALGSDLDATYISLDLAVMLLRQNRREEARRVAQEILPTFWALGMKRESLAAMLAYRQAINPEHLGISPP